MKAQVSPTEVPPPPPPRSPTTAPPPTPASTTPPTQKQPYFLICNICAGRAFQNGCSLEDDDRVCLNLSLPQHPGKLPA
ncbi:unnamed protein product [Gadus morhua 'NCC']